MNGRGELRALARKYRVLLELRRAHAETGEVAERAVLRALAAEFPGALRELDSLPLATIEERLCALEAVDRGAPCEPWMEWLVGYHAILRAALFIKAHRAKAEQGIADEELARRASEHAGIDIVASFVEKIGRPERIRISHIALDEVANRFGVSRELVEAAITAPTRPSRRAALCR